MEAGVETRLATYEELEEDNLIISNSFVKGMLLVLETSKRNNHSFQFSIEKWKSSKGAYGYSDCIATKKENKWTYEIGHTVIS